MLLLLVSTQTTIKILRDAWVASSRAPSAANGTTAHLDCSLLDDSEECAGRSSDAGVDRAWKETPDPRVKAKASNHFVPKEDLCKQGILQADSWCGVELKAPMSVSWSRARCVAVCEMREVASVGEGHYVERVTGTMREST